MTVFAMLSSIDTIKKLHMNEITLGSKKRLCKNLKRKVKLKILELKIIKMKSRDFSFSVSLL
jgi:hypothetical protein